MVPCKSSEQLPQADALPAPRIPVRVTVGELHGFGLFQQHGEMINEIAGNLNDNLIDWPWSDSGVT